MPDCHQATPDGLLMIANGIDPMLIWDGQGDIGPAGLLPPTAALTLSAGGTGALTGTYYAYVRFLDARGNISNLSPLAGPVTVTNAGQINYTNVPRPTQPKATRRQILRNTNGQALVFYVDVDVNDVTSTQFHSTQNDVFLASGIAQPLLDTNSNLLANTFNPPPAHKAVLAHHLDRMFAAVEIEYTQGSVAATFGSKTVTGIGTEWPTTFAGRFLYVTGAGQACEILSVDVAAQTLTLVNGYPATTQAYTPYAVRPPASERRLVYYSLSGLPEAWPLTQALSLQEDGDELTGLMANTSFLYLLERRHIYRFTFQSDPAADGFVFLSTTRGCINQRCWVIVDNDAYMLDEAGVYKYAGSKVEPLSGAIQDLFEPEGEDGLYKINWAARANFHASYHPGQNVIRWFVALSGSDFPRHALCMELGETRWWIEEYPVPIGGSCLGRFLGEPRVFLGGPKGQVFLFGEGQLDQARPGPTLRGTATSAGLTTLTDSAANFSASLIHCPVSIVSGRGRGQRRIVADVTATSLALTQPWLVLPDSTSVYQVGGIQWRYRTKLWRYREDDEEQPRRLELLFEPMGSPTQIEVRAYQDRSGFPVLWGSSSSQADDNGFSTMEGDEVLLGDLTRRNGFLQKRLDGFRDLYADGPRFLQLQLSGVINQDILRLYSLSVDGVK